MQRRSRNVRLGIRHLGRRYDLDELPIQPITGEASSSKRPNVEMPGWIQSALSSLKNLKNAAWEKFKSKRPSQERVIQIMIVGICASCMMGFFILLTAVRWIPSMFAGQAQTAGEIAQVLEPLGTPTAQELPALEPLAMVAADPQTSCDGCLQTKQTGEVYTPIAIKETMSCGALTFSVKPGGQFGTLQIMQSGQVFTNITYANPKRALDTGIYTITGSTTASIQGDGMNIVELQANGQTWAISRDLTPWGYWGVINADGTACGGP